MHVGRVAGITGGLNQLLRVIILITHHRVNV